jgi:E3 ubiquitin-protein ligase RAD18
MTPCPICGQRMKDWQVFGHLDKCTSPPSPAKPQLERSSTVGGFGFIVGREGANLERLSPLNYSMMKDAALRKKMIELGLSTAGLRQLVERRHREWVTIWNANCDAARPKKRRELLQELELWERTQSGRASGIVRTAHATTTTTVRDKGFDGAAWAAKHDSSFKELIAQARRSRSDPNQTTPRPQIDGGETKRVSTQEDGAVGRDN